MAKKYKVRTIDGVRVVVPCKKWEQPMKERSPRSEIFADGKHFTKASRSKEKVSLKKSY